MSLPEHSKIINDVTKQVFKPFGLERKGQSRTWLDDHGWYTTIVEFQPFTNRQGTCVNVGVNFHWHFRDYMTFDIGNRESEFVDYKNESQFNSAVDALAHHALDKVIHYRHLLENLERATLTILKHKFTSDELWGSYHKGIICGLSGNIAELNNYFIRLLNIKDSAPFVNNLKDEISRLKAIANGSEHFEKEIINIIVNTRRLKKLKEMDIALPKKL